MSILWLMLIADLMGVALGFCLGMLYCVKKLRKVHKNSHPFIEGLNKGGMADYNEKLAYVKGRQDVVGELLK